MCKSSSTSTHTRGFWVQPPDAPTKPSPVSLEAASNTQTLVPFWFGNGFGDKPWADGKYHCNVNWSVVASFLSQGTALNDLEIINHSRWMWPLWPFYECSEDSIQNSSFKILTGVGWLMPNTLNWSTGLWVPLFYIQGLFITHTHMTWLSMFEWRHSSDLSMLHTYYLY